MLVVSVSSTQTHLEAIWNLGISSSLRMLDALKCFEDEAEDQQWG
jgi:hypothetical protein